MKDEVNVDFRGDKDADRSHSGEPTTLKGHGNQAAKLAVGVPMPRLIPRQLVDSAEILFKASGRSAAAERFRRLKTTLLHLDGGAPQTIVVTSATPGEGKSLVAMNLAMAFATDKGGETVLIDADLRRPRVGSWLTPEPSLGLSEILAGRTELVHALLDLKGSSLKVLPAGEEPDDPTELLGSDLCKALMAELRRRFARIIIDTPPILPFTDADVVGKLSDGILLVARAGQTPQSVFTKALDTVTSTRLLGIVLNDARRNLADRGRFNEGYYNAYYSKDRRDD